MRKIMQLGSLARRFLRWIAITGIAVPALVAIYIGREWYASREELRLVMQRLEADGDMRPLGEVVPIPPAEALANGRKLFAAIEGLKQLKKAYPAVRFGPEVMQIVAPGKARSGVWVEKPDFGGEFSLDWDAFRHQVAQGAAILQEAREILKHPTALEYDYTVSPSRINSIGETQDLLVWLRASALLRVHDGDTAGAIEDLTCIRQLCATMGASGALVRQAMAYGMWLYGWAGPVWELLENGTLTEAELLRLREIATGDFINDGLRALEVEFEGIPSSIRQLADSASFDLMASYFFDTEEGIMFSLRKFLWLRIWMPADEAQVLTSWAGAIRKARTLIDAKNWQRVAAYFEDAPPPRTPYDRWRFPWAEAFSGITLSKSILQQSLRAENQCQMVQVVIALKRYRLRHGDYPGDLKALVPDFLPSLPTDWYDGQSLKYRREADGSFLLYSVGKNGIDEKGDASTTDGKSDFTNSRDIVWPQPMP